MRRAFTFLLALIAISGSAWGQIKGDMNCDGVVNDVDCPAMALAMTDPSGHATAYPACPIDNADMNSDGLVDCGDYPRFLDVVALVPPGGCGWAYSECPLQPFGAFAVADDAENEGEPAVACESAIGVCLVVWRETSGADNHIAARFVGHGGIAFGNTFVVDGGGDPRGEPAVAFDVDRGRFLVVWSQLYPGSTSDYDIRGRFIPLAGPDPTLTAFEIGFTTREERDPALAWCDSSDEFLVVWTSVDVDGFRIDGRRVLADGLGTVGSEFVITDGPEERTHPALVWDRRGDRYLLAYVRSTISSPSDVWLRRMLSSGSQIGVETGIAAWPGTEQEPSIGVLRGDPLVVWIGAGHTYARWVGDGGLPSSPPLLLSSASSIWDATPNVTCHDLANECRLAWTQTDQRTGVVLRRVGGDSGVGPLEHIRTPPPTHSWDVYRLVSARVLDRLLLVWDRDGPGSWDVFGRIQPMAIFGDGFETGDDSWWNK